MIATQKLQGLTDKQHTMQDLFEIVWYWRNWRISHMNGMKLTKPLTVSTFVRDNTKLLSHVIDHQHAEGKVIGSDQGFSSQHYWHLYQLHPLQLQWKVTYCQQRCCWQRKICSSYYSQKSSELSELLFPKMFPDSTIASLFKFGEVGFNYRGIIKINYSKHNYFK